MKLKNYIPTMALIFSWAAAGCLGRIGDECKMDSECRSGLICFIPPPEMCGGEWRGGTCRRPCLTDDDCRSCEDDADCGSSICVTGGACFREPLPASIGCDASTDVTSQEPVQEPVSDPDALDPQPDDAQGEREVPGDCAERDAASDDGACSLPTSFASTFKITLYHVGTDGHPGSGLDMDGNPATCSPDLDPPGCSDGIDNGMALLGLMGNSSLDASIEEGTMNIIVELTDLNDAGCPFYLDYLVGIRQSGNPGCTQEPGCVYAASVESFDTATCLPVSSVGNAFLDGTALTAGGDEFVYLFDAVVVGLHIVVPVLRPRVQAQVQLDGSNIAGLGGILGGFIREEDFIQAFMNIPEDQYPPSMPRDRMIQTWRDYFDLDGDTVRESSSIGIIFEAAPVVVSGVQ